MIAKVSNKASLSVMVAASALLLLSLARPSEAARQSGGGGRRLLQSGLLNPLSHFVPSSESIFTGLKIRVPYIGYDDIKVGERAVPATRTVKVHGPALKETQQEVKFGHHLPMSFSFPWLEPTTKVTHSFEVPALATEDVMHTVPVIKYRTVKLGHQKDPAVPKEADEETEPEEEEEEEEAEEEYAPEQEEEEEYDEPVDDVDDEEPVDDVDDDNDRDAARDEARDDRREGLDNARGGGASSTSAGAGPREDSGGRN